MGMSPNDILSCEPWGHMDHSGGGCECLSSDSMGAYIHDMLLVCECLSSDSTGAYVHDLLLVTEEAPSAEARDEARDEESSVHCVDCSRDCELAGSGAGRPGSVPFVPHRPGPYGRLLLAVYVRWKTGLLVAFDWMRLVMRGGGGWRTAPPVTARSVADVS